ncbi:MAG: hypothetical protein HOV68_06015 [Streptomycetaceae bacterium]|nr:hypothetical protein [Streptomycetaceae bacterium]
MIHDPPLWDGTALLSMPGWCAGGPRALLDFETPIREATIRAEAQWAAWAQASRGCPPAVPHEEFWARHRADPDEYPCPQARQDYLAQPLVQALAALEGHQPVPFFPNAHMIWSADPVVLIARGRSEFVRRAASRVISRAALLTLDGRWLDEDGGTGYADPPEPPESGLNLADEYAIECTDYLLGLVPETVVVRIRCHC